MTQTVQPNVDLEKFTITYLEDGIIENYLKPNQIIDCDDVIELQKQNLLVANGKPYVLLVITGDASSVTKEARELTASKEMVGIKLAKAYVMHSLAHRIIGNFYTAVNKPHLRTKIFTDREKAIAWLREIVQNHHETN